MSNINDAILLLVNAGYTVSRNTSAPATSTVSQARQSAPFGYRLDGTPKRSAAGRPPKSASANHAAAPAPAVLTSAPSVDFLDLDLGPTTPAPAPTPKPTATVKASAPKPSAPAPAAPVPAPTAREDEILRDLADLVG